MDYKELEQYNEIFSEVEQSEIEDIELANALIVEEITDWVNGGCAWLSQSTDYARGYKAGILQAQIIVGQILQKHGIELK